MPPHVIILKLQLNYEIVNLENNLKISEQNSYNWGYKEDATSRLVEGLKT